jgi:flagellar biosynthesis component FlhA
MTVTFESTVKRLAQHNNGLASCSRSWCSIFVLPIPSALLDLMIVASREVVLQLLIRLRRFNENDVASPVSCPNIFIDLFR